MSGNGRPPESAARRGLLSSPEAVDGAFPATEVDWSLRIDFAQHAGSAILPYEEAGLAVRLAGQAGANAK